MKTMPLSLVAGCLASPQNTGRNCVNFEIRTYARGSRTVTTFRSKLSLPFYSPVAKDPCDCVCRLVSYSIFAGIVKSMPHMNT